MKIPILDKGNIVNQGGELTPEWKSILGGLFSSLQENLSDEGHLIPHQNTADISFLFNDADKSGGMLYDSVTHQFKGNVNGVPKIFQVGAETLLPGMALITDENGDITHSSNISAIELEALNDIDSNVQQQLNSKHDNLTFTLPLLNTDETVSLEYNNVNFKLEDNALNTIQDIATTATPVFANGDIEIGTPGLGYGPQIWNKGEDASMTLGSTSWRGPPAVDTPAIGYFCYGRFGFEPMSKGAYSFSSLTSSYLWLYGISSYEPSVGAGTYELSLGPDSIYFYRTFAGEDGRFGYTLDRYGIYYYSEHEAISRYFELGINGLSLGFAGTNTLLFNSGTGTLTITTPSGPSSLVFTVDTSGTTHTQFVSTVATGTAPFSSTSTTVCPNVNADYLDGQHGSYYAPISVLDDAGFPTGFVDRVAVLSFDDGTLTFTITGSHDIYISGKNYEKTTTSKVIADTSGLHWVYYDSLGDIQETVGAPSFYGNALIALIYWDSVLMKGLLYDERHSCNAPVSWHIAHHATIGCLYSSGLAGTFTDTTLSIGTGGIFDEDLYHGLTIAATSCNVLYKDGSPDFAWDLAQTTIYKTVLGTIQYNDGNALADVDNNKYVAYWVFATGDVSNPIYSFMGQRQDTTIANARNNNTINSLTFSTWPTVESRLLYRVIFRNAGGTPDYIESADYRNVTQLPSSPYVATDHQALSNLYLATTGITYGHIDDQAQILYGPKIFNDFVTSTNFISTVATGTAPFSSTSTTECTNLNAAKCNGYHFDQSLLTTDSPTFAGITNTGLTATTIIYSNATKQLTSLANGTSNQVLGMNNTPDGFEYKTLAGTANQVTATHSSGAVTFSTPQDIATASSPTFADLTLSGLTASEIVQTDAAKKLVSVTANTAYNQTFEADTADIKMNGAVSVGVLDTIARADHIHASDTSKQNSLTPGSISETTSSILTITNGANSTVGPNVTIAVTAADASNNGYLSSADWTTFNNKLSALTFSYPLLNTVGTISLNYNSTNLKITANELNTIQDIATTATPSFASGNIEIGTIRNGAPQIWNKSDGASIRLGSSETYGDATNTYGNGYSCFGENAYDDTQDASNFGRFFADASEIILKSCRNSGIVNTFYANHEGGLQLRNRTGMLAFDFNFDSGTGVLAIKTLSASSLVVDQSFLTTDSSDPSTSAAQTFTAGMSGRLDAIEILHDSGSGVSTGNTVSIYNITGGGALIAQETGVDFADGVLTRVLLSEIPYIINTNVYSITITGGTGFEWAIDSAGGYAGGSYNGTAEDAVFQTLMTPELDFIINSSGTTHTQFVSTVATGTAPFASTSTTVCTNLNADRLDGYDAGPGLNNILYMNSSTISNVTIGSSLTFASPPTLDTIQDIRTTATPTWAGATLDAAAATEVALTISSAGTAKWKVYRPASSTDFRVYDSNKSRDMLKLETGGTIRHYGDNVSTTGTQYNAYTSVDNYPAFQILAYTHDNININFDSYYDGTWRSSDAGSNFRIRKQADKLEIWSETGIAQGSTITWDRSLAIDTSGRYGFGVDPSDKIHVSAGNVRVVSSGATYYGINYYNGSNRWLQTCMSNFYLGIWYNGNYRGDFSITDGTYTKSSDRRLKENIRQITNALERIKPLEAVTYNMIEDKAKERKIGLIHDNVLPTVPESCSWVNMKDDNDDLYGGVSYDGFGVLAIAGIQEQQAIINTLEQRIAELENKVLALL